MSSELPSYRRERKFTLKIPEVVMGELEEIANRHFTTTDEVMRKIFKVGLLLIAIEEREGRVVFRKTDSSEVEVRIFGDEPPTPPVVGQKDTSDLG